MQPGSPLRQLGWVMWPRQQNGPGVGRKEHKPLASLPQGIRNQPGLPLQLAAGLMVFDRGIAPINRVTILLTREGIDQRAGDGADAKHQPSRQCHHGSLVQARDAIERLQQCP